MNSTLLLVVLMIFGIGISIYSGFMIYHYSKLLKYFYTSTGDAYNLQVKLPSAGLLVPQVLPAPAPISYYALSSSMIYSMVGLLIGVFIIFISFGLLSVDFGHSIWDKLKRRY